MNVTIKISDEIRREARRRASDAGHSLSEWIENLIRKELSQSVAKSPKLLSEALGNEELAEIDLHLPREKSPMRETDFL